MRIAEISFVGFRGAKTRVTLPIGSGFTIVTGRNGSGKTTMCDAVEFVLTGSIRRFAIDTENQERIEDYIWWRGEGEPQAREASVTFVDDKGMRFTVTRGLRGVQGDDKAHLLYDQETAPEQPLQQLCLTSIIRDELITTLSTDLNETQRFEFVRAASGLSEGISIENRIVDALKHLRRLLAEADSKYMLARERVNLLTAQVSEANAQVARASEVDLDSVRRRLLSYSRQPIPSTTQLLAASGNIISDFRAKADQLESLLRDLGGLERESDESDSRIQASRIAELENQLGIAQQSLDEARAAHRASLEALERQRNLTPFWTQMAELHNAGLHIGRRNESCPLCAQKIGERAYQAQVQKLKAEVDLANADLTTLVKTADEAERRVAVAESEMGNRQQAYAQALKVRAQSENKKTELLNRAGELAVELDRVRISETLSHTRETLNSLLTDVAVLRSNEAIESLSRLEDDLSIGRNEAADISDQLARVRAAISSAENILATVRRASHEIIDERLSSISPLMAELYARLRPHVDLADG